MVTVIFSRGLRVVKSLTFLSIILGLLLVWDTSIIINLNAMWKAEGLSATSRSFEYYLFIIVTSVTLMLLVTFYYVEKNQNSQAQDEANNIGKKLDTLIKLAMAQTIKKDSSLDAKDKPNEQTEDKPIKASDRGSA